MNLFADIRVLVIDALDRMGADGTLPGGLDTANVAVEPPRDAAHGDMATNAAMVLAGPAKRKPRDIADALVPLLAADPRIAEATGDRAEVARSDAILASVAQSRGDQSTVLVRAQASAQVYAEIGHRLQTA